MWTCNISENLPDRDLELAEHSTQLLKAIEASDKLRDLLRESEETLLRCKETSGEDYAKYAVSVSLFDQQLQTSISKCESKEVQVTELRISLQSHEAAEQVLTTQLCNLKSQLAEYLRREKEQAEAKNLGEHLRKEQSKRKPWFLFFWPF